MEKEDILLGLEMERLEIEQVKLNKNKSNGNPFMNQLQKRNIIKNAFLPKESKCTCTAQRKTKHSGIHKKKYNKVIKEPVLSILKNCGTSIILETEDCQHSSSISHNERCESLSLSALVNNCNQLTIMSCVQNAIVSNENYQSRWWKNEQSCTQESKEPKQHSRSGSCSQQALNPPCDVTIDELASYFETLVHIPKKMSSMAEMMYI